MPTMQYSGPSPVSPPRRWAARPRTPHFPSGSFVTPGQRRPVSPPSPSERLLLRRQAKELAASRPSLPSHPVVPCEGRDADGADEGSGEESDGFEIIGSNPVRRSPPPPLPPPAKRLLHRLSRPQPTHVQRHYHQFHPPQPPHPRHQPNPLEPPPPMQMPRVYPTATQGTTYKRDAVCDFNTFGMRPGHMQMLAYGGMGSFAESAPILPRLPTARNQSQEQPSLTSHSQTEVQHMLGLPQETYIRAQFSATSRSRPPGNRNDVGDGYV
ncbi:uncharacterized protein SPSK_05524 [Sporothrix schenckii 1099-18]|uniref:Uncharacterized protein n=1 Tax=Sporothrix schenckii 1099-18 TaxID=1397361 RepID=A0A0F2LV51_SPOSC|nr:uncharacterized protein SPSK_05524 [Sporothrix schenckii 1099-18]KJR80719.1 hypothetical protein SPSK_05524 [Sporothrix schenckii 1099-18]